MKKGKEKAAYVPARRIFFLAFFRTAHCLRGHYTTPLPPKEESISDRILFYPRFLNYLTGIFRLLYLSYYTLLSIYYTASARLALHRSYILPGLLGLAELVAGLFLVFVCLARCFLGCFALADCLVGDRSHFPLGLSRLYFRRLVLLRCCPLWLSVPLLDMWGT